MASEATLDLFNAIVVDFIKYDEVSMALASSIVVDLVSRGADVDYLYPDSNSGYTLLMHSIVRKMPVIARKLIENGAKVDARCNKGIPTVIHALMNCPDVVDDILDKGIDLDDFYIHNSEESTIRKAILELCDKFDLNHIKDRIISLSDKKSVQNLFSIFDMQSFKKEVEKEKSESRKHYLKGVISSGNMRPSSIVNGVDSLDDMYNKFPNFSQAIDFFRKQVALHSLSANGIMHMKPLLMVGPPGVGKTRFTDAIAKAINLEIHNVSCGAISAGWVIGGTSTSWSEGRPGLVLTSMRDGESCNPIIMLDEIDKLSGDTRFDGFGSLYSLLENHTSSKFVDESIGLPINCSKVSFVATANDLSTIPEPIQTRFTIVEIQSPSHDQMRKIIPSIYDDIVQENASSWGSRFSKTVSEDVVEMLLDESPRGVHNKLSDAFGQAAISRKCEIYSLEKEDVSIIRKVEKRIGF